MHALRDGLGVLLLGGLVLRVGAWLVTPALPLVVTMFVMLSIIAFLVGGRRRW